MKLISILILSILLVGCESIKPWPKFPDEPNMNDLCQRPAQLPANDPLTISELMNSVVENYGVHHYCASRVEIWQEWYKTQRKIYEDKRKESSK